MWYSWRYYVNLCKLTSRKQGLINKQTLLPKLLFNSTLNHRWQKDHLKSINRLTKHLTKWRQTDESGQTIGVFLLSKECLVQLTSGFLVYIYIYTDIESLCSRSLFYILSSSVSWVHGIGKIKATKILWNAL